MSYSLNGTDLSSFGFIAGQQQGGNIGLSGFLDMPARLGKTFHSWGDKKGIQPYVSANEIRFGGRDLQLVGWIIGTDKPDCLAKSKAMVALVDGFTSLVTLATDWGTFNVQLKRIDIQFLDDRALTVVINMREPIVNMIGTMPTPDNGEFGIDNISFSALGGFLTEFKGDRRSRPDIKEQHFTEWQNEGYQITKTQQAVLDLAMFISAPNYPLFKAKIQSLCALFSAPGTRIMNVVNDQFRELFVPNGFTVTNVNSGDVFRGIVNFKAIQVHSDFYFLTDNSGNYITDNSNNKILIK